MIQRPFRCSCVLAACAANLPLSTGPRSILRLPIPLANILDLFNLKKLESPTYDLRVRTGDVYAYIARNGRRIVFQVTEMRQSTISPFRRRMSIMFFNVDNS